MEILWGTIQRNVYFTASIVPQSWLGLYLSVDETLHKVNSDQSLTSVVWNHTRLRYICPCMHPLCTSAFHIWDLSLFTSKRIYFLPFLPVCPVC